MSLAAQAMGIQRYIFFSIHNAEKHPEVPLMQVKTCTEKFIQESGLNYTIFRLCGFMQVCHLSYSPFWLPGWIQAGACHLCGFMQKHALQAHGLLCSI